MRTFLIFAALLLPAEAGQDDDQGFERVFNGKDFTGIKFCLGKADQGPGKTFRVEEGAIVCSGRPAGYWYTEKSYKNFTLRFEYRYAVPAPEKLRDDEKKPDGTVDDNRWRGNSGYLLFMQEQKVWPKSLEIQGMNRDVLGIINISGFKGKKTFEDGEARRKVRKPLGEWNTVEIVSKGRTVNSYLNGALISTVKEVEDVAGPIGFQSEGSEIHWRNIRIKTE